MSIRSGSPALSAALLFGASTPLAKFLVGATGVDRPVRARSGQTNLLKPVISAEVTGALLPSSGGYLFDFLAGVIE